MANTGSRSVSAVSLVLIAMSLLAVPRECAGFIRIMGNSDIYCGYEGSYCYADTVCCSGLVCRYGYKRFGGVCERESPAYPPSMPELPPRIDCQADRDCPTGQCCVNVPIGVRGASIRACRNQCPDKDVDAILNDFYTRYYRSSYYNRRRRRNAD